MNVKKLVITAWAALGVLVAWEAAGVVATNWWSPWPSEAGTEAVEVKEEHGEGKKKIYSSAHFQAVSDVELSLEEAERALARLEGDLAALAALPFNLRQAMEPQGTIRVFLATDETVDGTEDAPDGNEGARKADLVLSVTRRSKEEDAGLVYGGMQASRELAQWAVRDAMGDIYWLGSGLGTYLGRLEHTGGLVRFDGEWGRAQGAVPGPIRRRRIPLPPLRKILEQRRAPAGGKGEQVRMDAGALLAMLFFARLDRDGRPMRRYLQRLQREGTGNPTELLRDGRSWKALEAEMEAAWRARRVLLRFAEEDGEKEEDAQDERKEEGAVEEEEFFIAPHGESGREFKQ